MKSWSRFEILGAQFIIGPIRVLIGSRRGALPKLSPRKKGALESLIEWLDKALAGVEVKAAIEAKNPSALPEGQTMTQLAEKEHAFWLFSSSSVLPQNQTPKDGLMDLKRICQQILDGKKTLDDDWMKLDGFCRKFSDYLDKLHVQELGGHPC